jgi:glycosyltransferase involved in cell wall biosynthesis
MTPLRIAYLIEDTAQSGGVRVVLAQADALIARYDASADDFVVGTFWLTVPVAWRLAGSRAVHLCQGYEGAFSVYQSIRTQIDDVYRLPLPKLVVGRSLVDICRRFSSDVTFIGQVVEDEFFRNVVPLTRTPSRVLLIGQAQADLRGVPDGYGAVEHARSLGATISLVRVSPWLPAPDEPTENAHEFHVALKTDDMTRLMHSCDIFLGPNHSEEGFGLPAAEAMASGIPCVLTAIPSFLSFDTTHDYALFSPERDPLSLGANLAKVELDAGLRAALSARGREVASQFRVATVADRLEDFFRRRHATRQES